MTKKLALLPGWGFAASVMQPLAQALSCDFDVHIYSLPALDHSAPEAWLSALDQCIEADRWLLGWSLGGMLAAQLAARRGAVCPGLITVASNAQFVASNEWPQAMPSATFAAFVQAFQIEPAATLTRFTQLCAQGAQSPRTLVKDLQTHLLERDAGRLSSSLELLARLDSRSALRRFNGPILHVLAATDGLLPHTAATALQALSGACVEVLSGCSHAMVLEQPVLLAQRISSFIKEPYGG